MNALLAAVIGVLLLNLPFGFWRAGTRRFSVSWFLAVHLPVPLVVGLRYAAGIGWHFTTFPLLVGAYLAGQYLGGVLRQRTQRRDTGIHSP